ncbi:MAG: hypothetical protein N3A01_07120 [Bacteroidales bacterium]|nr:hypothetical protein [Bacteroidales bacterium]
MKSFFKYLLIALLLLTKNTYTQHDIDFTKVFAYRQVQREEKLFKVTLLINTHGLSKDKILKLKEKYPQGLKCRVIEGYGSTHVISENSVLFIWSVLPAADLFIIKYELVSTDYISENINISGSISYLIEGGIKFVSVEQIDFLNNVTVVNKIKNIPPYQPGAQPSEVSQAVSKPVNVQKQEEQAYEPPKPKPRPGIVDNPTDQTQAQLPAQQPAEQKQTQIAQPTYSQTQTTYPSQQQISQQPTYQKEEKVIELPPKTYTPSTTKAETQSSYQSKSVTTTTSTSGFFYTIQIGASTSKMSLSYFHKYGFDQPIIEMFVDNMYKYSVGKFSTLKEAKAYQSSSVTPKGIQSFIVAYNNGAKISTKEALAISKE